MEEENKDGGSFSFKDKRKRYEDEDVVEDEAVSDNEPKQENELAEQSAEPMETAGASGAPPVDFSTFVLSLASGAAYHMGGFQDPVSGKTSIDLGLAKQSIDILAMMDEKTKGNLTKEEANLISHSLYDLRMKFVEASKG